MGVVAFGSKEAQEIAHENKAIEIAVVCNACGCEPKINKRTIGEKLGYRICCSNAQCGNVAIRDISSCGDMDVPVPHHTSIEVAVMMWNDWCEDGCCIFPDDYRPLRELSPSLVNRYKRDATMHLNGATGD